MQFTLLPGLARGATSRLQATHEGMKRVLNEG